MPIFQRNVQGNFDGYQTKGTSVPIIMPVFASWTPSVAVPFEWIKTYEVAKVARFHFLAFGCTTDTTAGLRF